MILIPAILESFRSLKDRTIKLSFETNEPTAEQFQAIALSNQKIGFLAFSLDEKSDGLEEVLNKLPKSDLEYGKTKSERLRNTLFVFWKQNKHGYEVFDDYYNYQMEKLIEHFKSKLQPDY